MELQKANEKNIEELAHLNLDLMLAEKYDQLKTIAELIPRMRTFLETDYEAYFVIHKKLKAGYILIKCTSEPIYIRQFYIKPEFQRIGLGQKTIKMIKDIYSTKIIDVEVMAWNELGFNFWKKAGFQLRCYSLRLTE